MFNKPARRNILLPIKIAAYVRDFDADLVITSLEYGLANRILKYNKFQGKIIHYLHGYPRYIMGAFYGFILNFITRYIGKYSNYVIANSEYTSVINKEMYNIEATNVFNVCVGYEFLNELKLQYNLVNKKSNSILFVGRLAKDKNVDQLIRAYAKCDLADSLLIIGDGPEKYTLEQLAKRTNKPVLFTGRLSQKEIVKAYLESEVFVSLNRQEPFGIVYLEALAANCKIICPKVGGHLDATLKYIDRCSFVSSDNLSDILAALNCMLTKNIQSYSFDHWHDEVSYDKLAVDLLNILNVKEPTFPSMIEEIE